MRRIFLLFVFPLLGCGGSVTGVPGTPSDGGVPPGPPPNGEVPTDHHPTGSTCSQDRAPGIESLDAGSPRPPPPGDAGYGECAVDADCTAGQSGRCGYAGNTLARSCSYDECFTDSDCGANGVCVCGAAYNGVRSARNVCSRNGGCALDTDCGPGGYCSPSVKENMSCNQGPAPAGYFCHTPQDKCVNDSDCRGAPGGFCTYQPQLGYWACVSIPICAG